MARRIWIIAKRKKVSRADIANAKAHNCPELANGIPPNLKSIVAEVTLPVAYEEPEPVEPEPARDLGAEIDKLKADYATLKAKVEIL